MAGNGFLFFGFAAPRPIADRRDPAGIKPVWETLFSMPATGCVHQERKAAKALTFTVLQLYYNHNTEGGGSVPICLKIDVLQALKDAGYSSYVLRKEKLMGNEQRASLRRGRPPTTHGLNRLCALLHCQPGDIISYHYDPSDLSEYIDP